MYIYIMNNSNIDKDNIILLVKIVESNLKLLETYKKLLNKLDILEENISRKFNDRDEENLFIHEIIESANNNYYKIAKNCIK